MFAIAVFLRLGCTRESCGEVGRGVVVERLWSGEGKEGLGVEGLERTRFATGEMGQKGGEAGSEASGLEGLVDLGIGVLCAV